jgi:magnesium-protoporphyrin IX monomethyl ester (oxidative) cyclase
MITEILLIKLNEPFREKQKPCYVPPIGLWSMKTFIEEKTEGVVNVDICDEHVGDDLVNILCKKRYDMFGISVQFSIQHSEYRRVVGFLKYLYPDTPIVVGGFHAAAVEKLIDVKEVCHGEGEFFMMKQLGYDFDGATMDSLPYPTFKKKDLKKYWNKKAPHDLESKTNKWMTIETSRGCNRNCSFCGVPKYWGKWRCHTTNHISNYSEYLVSKGVKELFIEDDNLSLSKERFLNLIDVFKDNNLWWSTPNGIQASTIYNKEVLKKLEGSTCWKLSLPFETGSENGRDLMKLKGKWMPYEKALKLVKILNNSDIKTVGFFIIGYPGETIDDIKRTLEYANELPLAGRHIHIAIPYPGTPLYDLCKENGYMTIDGEELYDQLLVSNGLITTPEFNPEIVEEIKKKDRDEAIKRNRAILYESSTSI